MLLMFLLAYYLQNGGAGGARTHTTIRSTDFKSVVSTYSTTAPLLTFVYLFFVCLLVLVLWQAVSVATVVYKTTLYS